MIPIACVTLTLAKFHAPSVAGLKDEKEIQYIPYLTKQ